MKSSAWEITIHKEDTDDLGAICKKPTELTAFNRFRRETKAELWGRSISRP
jgi:hypothetical protein